MRRISILLAAVLCIFTAGCYDAKETKTVDPTRAVITAEPHFGPAPLDVSFSAEGSYLPGGGEQTYKWNFDDADDGTDEGMTASHTFDAPGTYVVSMTVSDPTGDRKTGFVVIVVN